MKKGGFDTSCIVYFIQVHGGGPIKIGASEDVGRRLTGLQTWSPFQLDILCEIKTTYLAEAFLHEQQKAFRIRGEWFDPNAALTEIIAHITEHGTFPAPIALELEQLWEIRQSLRRRASQYGRAPYYKNDAKQKGAY